MKLFRILPHRTMTLVWWHKNRNSIDFDPPYQRRGRVWSEADKAYLIDSILNGFDIPKLYFADFQFGESPLNIARKSYAIIDGKQRLNAVFDFFDNNFCLGSDFRYRKNLNLTLGGLYLRDLKSRFPEVADEFENASLDIMSVVASDPQDVHEIFVRLNRSKPLAGAEVRNAVRGRVPEVIRDVAAHDFFKQTISFKVLRASDLNAAAKVLLFEYLKKITSTKKKDLDAFAEGKKVDGDQLELALRRTIDVLDVMLEIFTPSDPLLSSSGIVPLYFLFAKSVKRRFRIYSREFLSFFEAARRRNREPQQVESHIPDSQILSRFDALNRSTNDQQSHEGRLHILKSQFNKWLEQNHGFTDPQATSENVWEADL